MFREENRLNVLSTNCRPDLNKERMSSRLEKTA
jgi:hypothetical protein